MTAKAIRVIDACADEVMYEHECACACVWLCGCV